MNTRRFLFLLCVVFACCSCGNRVAEEYSRWISKYVDIPTDLVFVKDIFDTVPVDLNHKIKVFSYNDSSGCLNCNLSLSRWKPFIEQVDSITGGKVSFVHVVNVANMSTLKDVVFGNFFHYPICVDREDKVNMLNHFSTDFNYRTFLLDSSNHIILIGNPVQNPKIKDLYLHTICEQLGIEYNQHPPVKMDIKNEINFGLFAKSESKSAQFVIPNHTESEIQIDTIFTSCECTTATIDNTIINPSGSANLTVSYTPDGVGEFYREVYVQIKGEERPRIYNIRGNVE